MENEHQSYYNNFYRELSLIDEANNSFSKIERLIRTLAPQAEILDIGCGHGSVSHELAKRGHQVTGVEVNREALASLRKKGIRPLEWDISKPFDLTERFDLVLLLDVLEHVFDPLALLQRAGGLLNEGGSLIVSVPLYFDLIDRLRILLTGRIISYDNLSYGIANYRKFRSFNYDHIRFFSPEDLWEMCRLGGADAGCVRVSAADRNRAAAVGAVASVLEPMVSQAPAKPLRALSPRASEQDGDALREMKKRRNSCVRKEQRRRGLPIQPLVCAVAREESRSALHRLHGPRESGLRCTRASGHQAAPASHPSIGGSDHLESPHRESGAVGVDAYGSLDEMDLLLAPVLCNHLYITRRPFVLTLHDLQEKYYPKYFRWKQRLGREVRNRSLSRRASRILCESRHVRDDLVRFLAVEEKRISIIPAPATQLFAAALSEEGLAV